MSTTDQTQPTYYPPPPAPPKARWSKKKIAAYVVAAFVLVGIGSELNSNSSTPAPTGKTHTVTHTVTKTTVPRSCLDALAAAHPIGMDAARLAHLTQGYIGLIPQAYAEGMAAGSGTAGSSGGGVTSGLHSLNDQVTALNKTLTAHVQAFNADSAACQAAAGR